MYRQIKEINEKKILGDEKFVQGAYDEAIEHYTTCIVLSVKSQTFSAKVYLNRGTCHTKKNNFADAVKDFTVAIAYNRAYVKAYTRRAESYMGLGGPEKIDKAIKDYETAVELESDETAVKALKEKIKKVR